MSLPSRNQSDVSTDATEPTELLKRKSEGFLLGRVVDFPNRYSRNRFPDSWDDPQMRRLRDTAALLRGLVRDLTQDRYIVEDAMKLDGDFVLNLYAPKERVRRTLWLNELEFQILSERVPGLHERLSLRPRRR